MGKLYAWCIGFVLLLFTLQDGLSKKHSQLSRSSDGKIVGGNETTIENAPYQAYLLLQKGSDYFQCGGSIISRRSILTAAHCMQGIERVYIRIGSANADSGGYTYVSTRFFTHPQYNNRTSDYDVAVIRLSQFMTINKRTTRIVRLVQGNNEIPPGTDVLVSGWGATSENGQTTTDLMAVEVPVISNDECRSSYPSLTDRMFCAGVPAGGKDSCQGDSGGPAVSTDSGRQLGIVSFGVGCARPGYPGVYTNIIPVRGWIRKVAGVI